LEEKEERDKAHELGSIGTQGKTESKPVRWKSQWKKKERKKDKKLLSGGPQGELNHPSLRYARQRKQKKKGKKTKSISAKKGCTCLWTKKLAGGAREFLRWGKKIKARVSPNVGKGSGISEKSCCLGRSVFIERGKSRESGEKPRRRELD